MMSAEIDGFDSEADFENGVEGAGGEAGLFDEKAVGDGPAPERQPTTVPLRALQEEREEKKALRSELETMRRHSAVLEDRWNTLLSLSDQGQPPPDPEQDIFAALTYERQQRQALEQSLTERDQMARAEMQAAEGQRQIWSYWHQDAAAFKAKAPEFDQAVRWMSEQRTAQLKALSGLNPEFRTEAGVARQINNELQAIVVAAAQSGVSPAGYIYEMAKQWGWRGGGGTDGGEFVPYRGGRRSGAEFSLSSMGGGAHSGPRTPEDVAHMSTGEFEAWLTRNGSRGFKRLMGGA
jgi:hypothetical protein